MTNITTSEIKILAIQVILMSILGVFMLLYSTTSTDISTPSSTASSQSTSISSSGGSWILGIIYIPEGMGVLAFISALVISPFLFFDAMIAIRFAKDISTQWV